jgi:hypothetical protein
MTDTTTMNGAQFRRHAGADPAKWAEAMLDATATAYTASKVERIALVAQWFRDYAEVCVAEAVARDTAAVGRLVPPAGEQTLDARANAAKDQAAAPTQ